MSENSQSQPNNSTGNSAAGEGAATSPSGTVTEIQKAQELAEKYKNDFLYLRAEFENFKRNAIKERSDLTKYGGERIVRDLLEVVDNFERALSMEVTADNFKTFQKGVEMTASELRSLLAKNNVTEVPAEGVPFDPNLHEALSSEESEAMNPGHVLRVFKKPYKLHDKMIRPGQVVVAKAPNK